MDIEEIRIKAFLKLIRYAEHKRDDDGVYFIAFGGSTFTDSSKHPGKLNQKWGKKSTSAGAYQIKKYVWEEARHKGIVDDFSPSSQDKLARWKLKTRKAHPYVVVGDFERAIPFLIEEWTSLPGGSEQAISMSEAKRRFEQYIKEYGQ